MTRPSARAQLGLISGIGIDVCEVARIQRVLEGPAGGRFRERVFTAGEQAYCEARRAARFESYAARFAAKEAALKAIGTGWARGVGWRDVEVVRNASGPPRLVLHGRAAALARARNMGRWHVALTHGGGAAIAWVLAERGRVRAGAPAAAGRRRAAGAGATRRRPTGRR